MKTSAPSEATTPKEEPKSSTALPPAPPPLNGFFFSSYGRMVAGTDLRGRAYHDADIVAHGSRLDESSYVELTLRRDDYWSKTDSSTRLVTTLAVANPIFHYTGNFDAKLAIRNLYVEERDLGLKGLSAWAGSRMYRGDDIYLLDWWPLDNVNTVGAGARYDLGKTYAAIHGGFSMPNTPFYFQQVDRPAPLNVPGSVPVAILERQRFIGSAKVSHTIPFGETGGIKIIGYAEAHHLPAGQRETKIPRVFETLSSDGGFVIGAQAGLFTGERNNHVNLFLRYASGLAAYGEFTSPNYTNLEGTTAGARELLAAVGGNWEFGPVGVMFGGYVRSFRDASAGLDAGDVDEGVIIARPHLFFGEIGGVALEGSYQVAQRGVASLVDTTGKPLEASSGPLTAGAFRVGLVPFLSPAGRGTYSRPQFRLIYLLTVPTGSAKALYPTDNILSVRGLEQFLGFGAEWWFNETTYGG